MNEMIDRVTRAMGFKWIAAGITCDGPSPSVFDMRELARAAIAAMHEPTAKMTQAAANTSASTDATAEYSYAVAIDDAARTWYAMIDAALD
jgi:hypothetical protein